MMETFVNPSRFVGTIYRAAHWQLVGKTMGNAIDENGRQVHIMGAVGHQSKQSYTQKKSEPCP